MNRDYQFYLLLLILTDPLPVSLSTTIFAQPVITSYLEPCQSFPAAPPTLSNIPLSNFCRWHTMVNFKAKTRIKVIG